MSHNSRVGFLGCIAILVVGATGSRVIRADARPLVLEETAKILPPGPEDLLTIRVALQRESICSLLHGATSTVRRGSGRSSSPISSDERATAPWNYVTTPRIDEHTASANAPDFSRPEGRCRRRERQWGLDNLRAGPRQAGSRRPRCPDLEAEALQAASGCRDRRWGHRCGWARMRLGSLPARVRTAGRWQNPPARRAHASKETSTFRVERSSSPMCSSAFRVVGCGLIECEFTQA